MELALHSLLRRLGAGRVTEDDRDESVRREGPQLKCVLRQHGGRVLFRGAKDVQLNRAAHGEHIVVAEFDSIAALRRWHDSPEYQQLIALRDAGADVVLTAYQSSQ